MPPKVDELEQGSPELLDTGQSSRSGEADSSVAPAVVGKLRTHLCGLPVTDIWPAGSSATSLVMDNPDAPNDDDDEQGGKNPKGTPRKKEGAEKKIAVTSFPKKTKKGEVTVTRTKERPEPCSCCVDREAAGKGNGGCYKHNDKDSFRCFDCHRLNSHCAAIPRALVPVGKELYSLSTKRAYNVEPPYNEVCIIDL